MYTFFSLCFLLLCTFVSVFGVYVIPRAQDVTWSSYNFKTVLRWNPKPINYTYTVEFSRVGKDRRRNPHCIRISQTECDLTFDLTEFKNAYTANVLSEMKTSDLVELPSTPSKKFCPYNDTVIGRPQFQMKVNEDKSITLHMIDQLTALYRDGHHLTIRDVFQQDLEYKIEYNKVGSTRMREMVVSDSQVQMNDLEREHGYCFSVAVFIPSRKSKRLSRWSNRQCSPAYDTSLINQFGPLVLSVGLLLIVILLILVITLIICCCRHKQRQTQVKSKVVTDV